MHIADITAVGKNSQIHLDHPDLNIETYLMLGVDNRIYILHDEPFQKALAWLEYNSEKKQLNFVMEDGDIRYLGVPVEKKFSQFLINQNDIVVAKVKNGELIDGFKYPLIKYEI